jgi:hypothetical protein
MIDFFIIISRHITFEAENLASPVSLVKVLTLGSVGVYEYANTA